MKFFLSLVMERWIVTNKTIIRVIVSPVLGRRFCFSFCTGHCYWCLLHKSLKYCTVEYLHLKMLRDRQYNFTLRFNRPYGQAIMVDTFFFSFASLIFSSSFIFFPSVCDNFLLLILLLLSRSFRFTW